MKEVKNIQVVNWLLSFVKPLSLKMSGAVLLGIISNLSVIGITFLGLKEMFAILSGDTNSVMKTFWLLILCGVIRGVARYMEQYLNHDIAFSLLANVRSSIFKVLRKLGPAKLSGKNSGDMITAITTDVEALEVFFAHTISPVFIAIGTSLVLVSYLLTNHLYLGLILLLGHLFVGVFVPVISYKQHEKTGSVYQETFVSLNQQVIENIDSIRDINQFSLEEEKLAGLHEAGEKLNQEYQKKLKQSSKIQILSEFGVIGTTILMILVGTQLDLSVSQQVTTSIITLSSFGSVLALSGLGNALLSTFASGKRLFALVNEEPNVVFNSNKQQNENEFNDLVIENLSFSYDEKQILDNLNINLEKGVTLGIGGESGKGKSTLLKLLMRYFDPNQGRILFDKTNLKDYSETELHSLESVMEQKTFIFADTIKNNISLKNEKISQEDIEKAAEAASLSEWIESLPDKYETKIGGQNRGVSDGEKQRIGLARVFLHDAPLLLLDEPTSSLDYLNEQKILHTIKHISEGKTTIVVSHRESTLNIADKVMIIE
ncbi:amino acid ABC transporter ATP-binding/permease protein [Vagococcus fluvialis]|uniref:amino acid ABC transporter ATP-binding/permease protein n=1 Tax=Vagococcus fluvialis TaxID=2738 RepID=UPI001D0B7F30|nr:ABC transporter ATP-binding protein [Vagococcus fluvialis]UDM70455.1 ABC transporter ATP-binding protein/permease [Vagococcus fluvialis]UDM77873.1 ABC transporter ATP-binding protein/permease [Vagococcus fluvialis]UDM82143.1 ABC transporter ATP-binding protein/permease [Vagococcus fluvialis]